MNRCEKCWGVTCICEYERLKRELKIKSNLDNALSWMDFKILQIKINEMQRDIPEYCSNYSSVNRGSYFWMKQHLYELAKEAERLYNKMTEHKKKYEQEEKSK